MVETWFLWARFLGSKNFPRFRDLFLGGYGRVKEKAKAMILSLRPSGFAPASAERCRALRAAFCAPLKAGTSVLAGAKDNSNSRSLRDDNKRATARAGAKATAGPPPTAKDDNQKADGTDGVSGWWLVGICRGIRRWCGGPGGLVFRLGVR